MTDHRHPLFELSMARLREFLRDPSAVFWTFGFPIVLAMALGIAFREAQPPKLVVVVDAELPDAAMWTKTLDDDAGLTARAVPVDQGRTIVNRGRAELLVTHAQTSGSLTYYFDPNNPDGRKARLLADNAVQRARGRTDAVSVSDERVTGLGNRYIDYLIPGLVGLNVMGSAIWGIGYSVVEARKRKLLKRLAATPMSRAHFLLSYMLSRLVFLVAEVGALLGFGWVVFDVKLHGSILALSALTLWGALSLTGVAILIASRPRSTEVASGWSNLFMMPMWLLSGVFFSYERFPETMIPFIRALPLTALNDGLRAVMNEGQGLLAILPELGILTVWGAVCFVLALRWFRWQ